jgi:hypothetical protein
MRVSLTIRNHNNNLRHRSKPDLFEDKQVEKIAREAGEKLGLRADLIEIDLNELTDKLETYIGKTSSIRKAKKIQNPKSKYRTMTNALPS